MLAVGAQGIKGETRPYLPILMLHFTYYEFAVNSGKIAQYCEEWYEYPVGNSSVPLHTNLFYVASVRTYATF